MSSSGPAGGGDPPPSPDGGASEEGGGGGQGGKGKKRTGQTTDAQRELDLLKAILQATRRDDHSQDEIGELRLSRPGVPLAWRAWVHTRLSLLLERSLTPETRRLVHRIRATLSLERLKKHSTTEYAGFMSTLEASENPRLNPTTDERIRTLEGLSAEVTRKYMGASVLLCRPLHNQQYNPAFLTQALRKSARRSKSIRVPACQSRCRSGAAART